MKTIKIKSYTENDTLALAKTCAKLLEKGSILALQGDLGLGKTTFVKGLAYGLELPANAHVQSPTYAFARTYPTKPILHHLDCYRLDRDSFDIEIGLFELIHDPEAIICIEWPSKLSEELPQNTLWLTFSQNESFRKIHIRGLNTALVEKISKLARKC